ncbi:maltose permease MAL31 [Metarhizium album ARSEF 1941]|uniref:Maltose permease MAL31 n=1 Tax=Metarhizium album (strain ARSEF 1941) TaxID=1081103 RepID=A0A0B2X406_METAS|nr:maltose permease MAL31 [Metarhizium album ARSEF 1941]KHO00160.1 maltose permease MAL31 [Metarhizium album ARSEF 1941]
MPHQSQDAQQLRCKAAISNQDSSFDFTSSQAEQGTLAEHALSVTEAIKTYPMAIFWALMVSLTVVMEGYDTALIASFFAYPPFVQKYGQFADENGQHQLSAPWQAGLANCGVVGAFFGTLINGLLVDRFGQRRVLVGALVLLSGFIFMNFFAPNIIVLAVGQLLCGFPWGIFTSSAPAYASEVLPLSLRVYLTSYSNMCFIIGQLIAAGVLVRLVDRTDEWAYRVPFAIQWLWPAVLVVPLCYLPESPWYWVRNGKMDEAEKSLRRLQRKHANIDTKATLANIVHTNELEKKHAAGTSYLDCFRGAERRRTEIACVAWAGQILAGSSFAYNSTYFFQQIGLGTDTIYTLNIGGKSIALAGTLVNWVALVPYFGRRQIYLCGLLTMSALLFVIGVLNVWNRNADIGMAQAVLTLVWTFIFQLSAGQLGWAVAAEVGSTRLRQKTICLARNSYLVAIVISEVLLPYLMNPRQWNLKGYTAFFWAATASLTFCWAFFRLPETKGRTYKELDWLFAKRTRTRAFAKAPVDPSDKVSTRTVQYEPAFSEFACLCLCACVATTSYIIVVEFGRLFYGSTALRHYGTTALRHYGSTALRLYGSQH